jgi:hypothetical protein
VVLKIATRILEVSAASIFRLGMLTLRKKMACDMGNKEQEPMI